MEIGNRPLSILLASGSPRRRALLADLGWRFEWTAPKVDESPLPGEAPEALCERLARLKAEAPKAREGMLVLAAENKRKALKTRTSATGDCQIEY